MYRGQTLYQPPRKWQISFEPTLTAQWIFDEGIKMTREASLPNRKSPPNLPSSVAREAVEHHYEPATTITASKFSIAVIRPSGSV